MSQTIALPRTTKKPAAAGKWSTFLPAPRGLLQRTCACVGTAGPGDQCAECRANKRGAQRLAVNGGGPAVAPPIVRDVLNSPGQPLDAAARAFMEPKFGHDFSRVRVHTDARAAESARSIAAHAYTVGQDIVFGSHRYAPETVSGRRLLAHELTHVVQQRSTSSNGPLMVGPPDDALELQAEAVALASQEALPPIGGTAAYSGSTIQRDSDSTDYAQGYHDGLRGNDANPTPRFGDPLTDYNEGYAKGRYEFDQRSSPQSAAGAIEQATGTDPSEGASNASSSGTEIGPPVAVAAPACNHSAHCPEEFCTPISWPNAQLSRLDTFAPILVGIGSAVSPRVIPLWNEFIWGGNSTVQDLSAQFANDFRLDSATARVNIFVIDTLKESLRANPPVFPPGENSVVIDIVPRIDKALKAMNNPNDPTNQLRFTGNSIPGNLAGGIGRDQAACPVGAAPSTLDDDRRVEGTATITQFPHIGTLLVRLSMNYIVDDTIDFCPGNCGSDFLTVKVTTLLSRWEASGISGDVPFTVKFPAPLPDQFAVELPPSGAGGQGN